MFREINKFGTLYYKDENGLPHRLNEPAAINKDGAKFWYRHGIRHRDDGPAIEYANGSKFWFLNGKWLTEEAFNKQREKLCSEK